MRNVVQIYTDDTQLSMRGRERSVSFLFFFWTLPLNFFFFVFIYFSMTAGGMLGNAHPQSRYLQRTRQRDQVNDPHVYMLSSNNFAESSGLLDYVTSQKIHTISARNGRGLLLLSDTNSIGRVVYLHRLCTIIVCIFRSLRPIRRSCRDISVLAPSDARRVRAQT